MLVMGCVTHFFHSGMSLTVQTRETTHIQSIIMRPETSVGFHMLVVIERFERILLPLFHGSVQDFQSVVPYPCNHVPCYLSLQVFAPAIHIVVHTTPTTQI